MLQDARPTLIITVEDGVRGVEARMPTVRVIRLTRLPRSGHKGWRPATMGVDEPACVLFTSGSTGRPKSIVNSQFFIHGVGGNVVEMLPVARP